jgi:hypothetical protein
MASSPALDRFVGRNPIIGPVLLESRDELPFPVTVNRLPDSERRLPDARLDTGPSVQWDHVDTGALAGFGGGFAWALGMIVLGSY